MAIAHTAREMPSRQDGLLAKRWRIWPHTVDLRYLTDEPAAEIVQCGEPIFSGPFFVQLGNPSFSAPLTIRNSRARTLEKLHRSQHGTVVVPRS
jgi:hypothetical protein